MRSQIEEDLLKSDSDASDTASINNEYDIDEYPLYEQEENFAVSDDKSSNSVFITPLERKESDFKVIQLNYVKEFISSLGNNLSEIMEMNEWEISSLIQAYKGDKETILREFSEHGKDELLKKIGFSTMLLHHPLYHTSHKELDHDSFTCESCFDTVNVANTSCLQACKHRFCNECWNTYLTLKITEKSRKFKCMNYKCHYLLGKDFIKEIVSSDTYKLYENNMLEFFMEDSQKFLWCGSTPYCGNIFYIQSSKLIPIFLKCNCGFSMCRKCRKEPHLPISCQMLEYWKKCFENDSHTSKWIAINTKDCPGCHTAIEKGAGCNHMACSCGTHWCWGCGGFLNNNHRCPGYVEKSEIGTMRSSLQRYLFYFEKYNLHETSRKYENSTKNKLLTKIENLFETNPNTSWRDRNILMSSMDILFISRLGLQFSYVFAYFMFDIAGNTISEGLGLKRYDDDNNLMKEVYELTQNELEYHVEILSKEIYQDNSKLNRIQNVLAKHAFSCEKKLEALFDLIRSEYIEPSYELPSLPHILT